MRPLLPSLTAVMTMLAAVHGSAAGQQVAGEPVVVAEDYVVGSWELYRHRFLTKEGRVVDDDSGSVSHSEGQGYGMLIAVTAGDRESFDKMLAWTERELFVRADRLAAWKWDPAASPHVVDTNNATDGDLLIAWALQRAAKRWHSEEYLDRSVAILDALADAAIADSSYGKVLLPGAEGFREGEQPDGPVVNLSYWVFPALQELNGLSPKFPAEELVRNGMSLLEALDESDGLPTDWTSLAGAPRPAQKFPAQFGYNAIRIPLYLAWFRGNTERLLETYRYSWAGNSNVPVVFDIAASAPLHSLSDQGYLTISDLVACKLGSQALADENRIFAPTTYYPSTLYILSLIAFAERYPTCVVSES
jgi:endo-1,4-beta-D-glucanase Y